MLIDVTDAIRIPGNGGVDCPANGTRPDVECCFDLSYPDHCITCRDVVCPRKGS